jgi:hypothetical protein
VKAKIGNTAAALLYAALLAGMPLGEMSLARAQVGLPAVTDPLQQTLDPTLQRSRIGLDSRIRQRVDDSEKKADELARSAVDEQLPETATTIVDESLAATEAITADPTAALNAVLRPFLSDADPDGWAIEKNVVVMLLDDAQLAALANGRFQIIARREMHSLGLTMVTLHDPNRSSVVDSVRDLRAALPDAAVDFNHIFRFAANPASAAPTQPQETDAAATGAGKVRIGMIDSAVVAEHFSLAQVQITAGDFVTFDGKRPVGHGTAVASLIAGSAGNQAQIFAASVFFETPDHAPGASTESLVAALDWLASQRVDVINMSLAGPPNALLERAVAQLTGNGQLLVAAVGNNGPSGEALYPAAYDGVIGVTAIDREKRIFRYANRGPHVDFAALGVDVKVADAGAGWRIESGTSMASPRVAVIVGMARKASGLPVNALVEQLAASAEDLGSRGFDPVFGHGLIARPPEMLSGN